jgi:hypothetical protein
MHHPPNHSATLIKKIHSTIPPFHPHLPHSTNQLPTEKTKKQKNTPPSHNCDPWTPFHPHLPHSTNQLPTEKTKKQKKQKNKKTPRLHTTATLEHHSTLISLTPPINYQLKKEKKKKKKKRKKHPAFTQLRPLELN